MADGRRTSSSCAMMWPLLCDGSLEEARSFCGSAGLQDGQVTEELATVRQVMDICAQVLEVDATCIEPLQLVKYTPGQFFKPHLDTHKEPQRLSSYNGEQRTHTLLVFMSDIPKEGSGGCLHFPLLGLRIPPRAGAAVLWRNCKRRQGGDGWAPDADSLHEGEAPCGTEKIAMNVWAVDRPFDRQAIMSRRQPKQIEDKVKAKAYGVWCLPTVEDLRTETHSAMFAIIANWSHLSAPRKRRD